MKLTWGRQPYITYMELSDGRRLEWLSKLWNRTGPDLTSDIFNTFNDYWAAADPKRLAKLEETYVEIYELFGMLGGYNKVMPPLQILMKELLDIYDWVEFKEWCILNGRLEFTAGEKDSLDPKDKEAITYFTEEYIDLVIFSVLLKTFIPIWGMFHTHMEKEVSKIKLLMYLIDLLRTTKVVTFPPWIKLEMHVNNFAEDRITSTGFSLLSDIGSEEIPEYLISMAMVKKVAIFDGRLPDKNIVGNMYHSLKPVCKSIDKKKPIPRKNVNEAKEELSITDRYKVVQPISPAISVYLEHYTTNPVQMILDIDPTVPRSLMVHEWKNLPLDIDICDFHIPVMAAVIKDVFNIRGLKNIDYPSFITILHVTNVVLRHWGLNILADLLLAKSEPRDIYQITIVNGITRVIKNLPVELSKELTELYPNIVVDNTKSPGHILINKIVVSVNRREWDLPKRALDFLKTEIAVLLIRVSK